MAALLSVRLCVLLLAATPKLIQGRKGGKHGQIDTTDVLNPDPNAPDPDNNAEYNTGSDLFEGDMKIKGGRKAGGSDRNAASDPNKLWPAGVVPYIFDQSAERDDVHKVVREAIADYNQYTCIKFQPRRGEVDYVRITTKWQGCWSHLGRTGEEQELNLGWGCVYKGTTIHEMMHAIGFEHEQKRGDRDNYVQIHFDNIPKDTQFNFEKIPEGEEKNMGFPYDFSSLMHYGQYAFAKDRSRPTITTRDPRNQNKIGQRAGFSKQDVKEVNRLYKCNGKTSGIKGKDGCLDKHRDYCENILGLKGKANPECGDEKLRQYCKVSCHTCDPGDGRGKGGSGGSGGGGGPKPSKCEDGERYYCETTLKLRDGPNDACNHQQIKDYCKKSCRTC